MNKPSHSDISGVDFSGMTFAEIEAKYGEEAAINAGIAADPDAFEADAEWFAKARPAREVMPEFVERWRKARDAGEIRMRGFVMVEIDVDLAEHFQNGGGEGDDWNKRLNDTLRKAVFGKQARRGTLAQRRKRVRN